MYRTIYIRQYFIFDPIFLEMKRTNIDGKIAVYCIGVLSLCDERLIALRDFICEFFYDKDKRNLSNDLFSIFSERAKKGIPHLHVYVQTSITPFTQLLQTRVCFTNAGINTYGAEIHKVRKHANHAFPSFLFLILLFRLYVKEPF